jgi:hypothetical protein
VLLLIVGVDAEEMRPSPALIAETNDLSTMRLLGLRQNDGSVVAPRTPTTPALVTCPMLKQSHRLRPVVLRFVPDEAANGALETSRRFRKAFRVFRSAEGSNPSA